jgi:membrane-associated phospholipid phosphatase
LRRRVAVAVALAALFAASTAATYAVSFASGTGRRADEHVFERLGTNDGSSLRHFGRRVGRRTLNTIAAVAVVLVAVMLAIASLLKASRVRAWVVVVLVAGSFLTTEALKSPLGHWGRRLAPDRVAVDAFPSGHATLAMAILLACVMAVPAPHRLAASILGLAVAALLGLLIVVGGLHPPSDVVGGFFVAAAWAALLTPFAVGRAADRPASAAPVIVASLLTAAFAIAGGVYAETVFGPHRLFLALVAALLTVSGLIVVAVGAASDLAERRT